MRTLTRRAVGAAAALAALAGLVDAIAYLYLGGYFVSFMSGNTTRGSVELATEGLPTAFAFVAAFLAGVILSTAANRRRHTPVVPLIVVTVFLVAAAVSVSMTAAPLATGVLLAAGMGAVNTVFAGASESSFGVTYMTGALVKLGQGLVTAVTGGHRTAWLRYLVMWLAIGAGAVAGALSYTLAGVTPTTWAAAIVSVAAAIYATLTRRRSST